MTKRTALVIVFTHFQCFSNLWVLDLHLTWRWGTQETEQLRVCIAFLKHLYACLSSLLGLNHAKYIEESTKKFYPPCDFSSLSIKIFHGITFCDKASFNNISRKKFLCKILAKWKILLHCLLTFFQRITFACKIFIKKNFLSQKFLRRDHFFEWIFMEVHKKSFKKVVPPEKRLPETSSQEALAWSREVKNCEDHLNQLGVCRFITLEFCSSYRMENLKFSIL